MVEKRYRKRKIFDLIIVDDSMYKIFVNKIRKDIFGYGQFVATIANPKLKMFMLPNAKLNKFRDTFNTSNLVASTSNFYTGEGWNIGLYNGDWISHYDGFYIMARHMEDEKCFGVDIYTDGYGDKGYNFTELKERLSKINNINYANNLGSCVNSTEYYAIPYLFYGQDDTWQISPKTDMISDREVIAKISRNSLIYLGTQTYVNTQGWAIPKENII